MSSMKKMIEWCIENAVGLIFIVWFLSSVLEFTGFVISVNHTDTETKVSVGARNDALETPIQKEKPKASDSSSTPPTETKGLNSTW
jgi:3,4-dihydroxy-2-butanone 4-phosphate synthase